MPFDSSAGQLVLLRALKRQREHVLGAVDGVGTDDLRRHVLPSGWSCIGLVNHLSLDVERFWFQAVIDGDQIAIDEVLASSDNAWTLAPGSPSRQCFTGTGPTSIMAMGSAAIGGTRRADSQRASGNSWAGRRRAQIEP